MKEFAREIAESAKSGDVIGLVGELGAGKTTYVQYLAKALGVTARVNSPTFLVMKIYNTNTTNGDACPSCFARRCGRANTMNRRRERKLPITNYQLLITKLVHIDAYRLKSGEELEALGTTEYIGAHDTVTVIEWADRVKKILPKKTRWIHFEHGKSEGERIITIS